MSSFQRVLLFSQLFFSCMITIAMYTSDVQHHSNIVSTHSEKDLFLTALADLCSGRTDGTIVSSAFIDGIASVANLTDKSVHLKVLREKGCFKNTYFERTYKFCRPQELATTTYGVASVFHEKYNQEIRDMFGADFHVGLIGDFVNQELTKRKNDYPFTKGEFASLMGAIHATRPGRVIFEKGKISVFPDDEAKQNCCC